MIQCVSILIPTHNRAAMLAKVLESLTALVLPADVQCELLVIANNCTDDTVAVASSFADKLNFPSRVVVEPTAGLAIARNRAVRESIGDVVAFLDDDVRVDPYWLVGLLDAYRQHDADVVGRRVCLWWEAIAKPAWVGPNVESLLSGLDCGTDTFILRAPILVGANYSFRRSAADRVGGFDESLGRTEGRLTAGEETEFTLRCMTAGLRIVYAGGALVHHWVEPQRVDMSYLRRVAYENGRARAFIKPAFGPAIAARTILGHVFPYRPIYGQFRVSGPSG